MSIDSRLLILHGRGPDNSTHIGDNRLEVVTHAIEWRGGLRLPIWETTQFELEKHYLSIPKTGSPFFLFWDAQAPMMERKAGVVTIEVANDRLSLKEEEKDWKYDNNIVHKI
jgi:hypothetical protein